MVTDATHATNKKHIADKNYDALHKTLQQEYQLIKEGKGNKDHFLKMARNMFPEYITHGNDFNATVSILKAKTKIE